MSGSIIKSALDGQQTIFGSKCSWLPIQFRKIFGGTDADFNKMSYSYFKYQTFLCGLSLSISKPFERPPHSYLITVISCLPLSRYLMILISTVLDDYGVLVLCIRACLPKYSNMEVRGWTSEPWVISANIRVHGTFPASVQNCLEFVVCDVALPVKGSTQWLELTIHITYGWGRNNASKPYVY